MPLYIAHTRSAVRMLSVSVSCQGRGDMGALARGARTLCAYPSHQRVTIFAPLARPRQWYDKNFSHYKPTTCKKLFEVV